jgi:hypothetical protein
MPSFVKTPADEKKWDEAKKAAEKSGKKAKDYWALVNHIYQNMKAAEAFSAVADRIERSIVSVSAAQEHHQYGFRSVDGPMRFTAIQQMDGTYSMAILGDDFSPDWGGQDYMLPSELDWRLHVYDVLWNSDEITTKGKPIHKAEGLTKEQVEKFLHSLHKIFRDVKPYNLSNDDAADDISLNSKS